MNNVRRRLFVLLLLSSFILHPSPFLLAQVPQLINYQGRLVNGTNLVNGTVGLSLRLHDAPVAGALLYEDSNTVSVVDGVYSTMIGDHPPSLALLAALTNNAVFIETAVNGVALSPRERLVSVAYAIGSLRANGVAPNAITSGMIASGAVQEIHLAAESVGSAQIADNSISSADLASSSVNASHILNGSVSTLDLASNAVTSAKVADGSLNAIDLAGTGLYNNPRLIQNPFPDSNRYFGSAIAGLASNRFVAGAFGEDEIPMVGAGRAYLYDADGTLLVTLTNPTPNSSENFGYAIATIGSNDLSFAVGCPNDDDTLVNNRGSVTFYTWSGTPYLTVENPTPDSDDWFGGAIAGLASNRVVIGARNDDTDALNCGRAYLYTTLGYFLVATMSPPYQVTGENFGDAICALGRDRMVIAASASDYSAFNSGRVYIYNLEGSLLYSVNNPTPEESDFFGSALAGVGQNRFVASAPYQDVGVRSNAGCVYLYNNSGSLIRTINNPVPRVDDLFGISLTSFGDDMFLVGASQAGSAYLYDYDGNLLQVVAEPNPETGSRFGFSLAALGTNGFLVGGYRNTDGPLAYSGRVHVYDQDSIQSVVTDLVAGAVARNTVGVEELDTGSVDARYVRKSGDSMSGALGIGTNAPGALLHVVKGSAGAVTAVASSVAVFENSGKSFVSLLAPTNESGGLVFGNEINNNDAGVYYNSSGDRDLRFRTGDNTDRVTINQDGDVGIGTNNPAGKLHVVGNVYAANFYNISDRGAKTGIQPAPVEEILAKVERLPIATWTYRENADGFHIGPMAQDFHAAFGLGYTETSIALVDANGVALAAIQALAKENERLDEQVSGLEEENRALREELDAIKRKLGM